MRQFGVFDLNLQSGELWRHGYKIRLPDQAFQILDELLSRPGEVVTRDELRRRLWKAGTFVAFDVGLNNAVRKLREALDDSSEHPTFIETVPRRGYRFIGSVQHGDVGIRPDPPGLPAGLRVRMVPIAGALLLLSILAVFAVTDERGCRLRLGSAHDIRALAVLPFENHTGDPLQEYLAEGITDTLTTHLAQIQPLSVVSRTSTRHYRQADKRLADIGAELNVDAVVQGAIVRSGDHVRISARLVEAASDRHVWAHTYDGDLGDILALQQRIAGDIGAAATGRGVPTSARTRRHQTVDPVAADAYLKGVFAFGQGTYEGFRTAVAYLEQAISRQNDYVDAYAALGQVQLQLLFVGPLSPRQVVPKAEAAVRKAIQLDETLPQPHQTLGTILTHFHWKWDQGDKEFRRAKELSGSAPTAGTSGMILELVRTGQFDEAIAQATNERDRDPRSISAQLNLAIAHRTAANYDRALAECRRALEMMPRNPRAHFQLGVTYALMGRYGGAIQELEEWEGGNPRFRAYLGYTYAAAGRSQDARKVLDDLKSRALEQYVSSFGIALIHDALGEKELALAALERAYEDRAVEFAQTTQYPRFKTIASEPRYEAVMRRVRLPR